MRNDVPDYSTMASYSEFVVGTPSTRETNLPCWETRTTEATDFDVCNVNDLRNTRVHKRKLAMFL